MIETPVKDRVKQHRKRKAAADFAAEWMDGKEVATPEEFIEGKRWQFRVKHNVGYLEFDASLTNAFYDALNAEYDAEDGQYTVAEMMDAWKEAQKQQ